MLKYESTRDHSRKLMLSGSLVDALADISYLIAAVHARLKSANPDAAAEFKRAMMNTLTEQPSVIWDAPDDAFDDCSSMAVVAQQKKRGD